MDNKDISSAFSELSTPLIADSCLRLKLPLRIVPPNIKPLIKGSRLAGQVLPVRHYGSVDIFLEAMGNVARTIYQTERKQAEAIKKGKRLREQLRFDEYLSKHTADPSYTFRKHLKTLGGAIEE